MNAFVNAAAAPQEYRTENGMKQLNKTGDALVDLFGKSDLLVSQICLAYLQQQWLRTLS